MAGAEEKLEMYTSQYVTSNSPKVTMANHLLPPTRAAEIFGCVCKYVDGMLQNLQSVSPY